jgi:hypothetical protein
VSDGNEKSGAYDGLNRSGLPSPPRRGSFRKWPIVLAITATFSIIRLLSNVGSDAAVPSASATATSDVSASVVAEVSPFPSAERSHRSYTELRSRVVCHRRDRAARVVPLRWPEHIVRVALRNPTSTRKPSCTLRDEQRVVARADRLGSVVVMGATVAPPTRSPPLAVAHRRVVLPPARTDALRPPCRMAEAAADRYADERCGDPSKHLSVDELHTSVPRRRPIAVDFHQEGQVSDQDRGNHREKYRGPRHATP